MQQKLHEKNILIPSPLKLLHRSRYESCKMKSEVVNVLCASGILPVADILNLEML